MFDCLFEVNNLKEQIKLDLGTQLMQKSFAYLISKQTQSQLIIEDLKEE